MTGTRDRDTAAHPRHQPGADPDQIPQPPRRPHRHLLRLDNLAGTRKDQKPRTQALTRTRSFRDDIGASRSSTASGRGDRVHRREPRPGQCRAQSRHPTERGDRHPHTLELRCVGCSESLRVRPNFHLSAGRHLQVGARKGRSAGALRGVPAGFYLQVGSNDPAHDRTGFLVGEIRSQLRPHAS